MIVQIPVIGIPNWQWKKDLIELAERKPNIHTLDIRDFCHECSRHKSMLEFFDGGNNGVLENNKYYIYHRKLGRDPPAIGKRMRKFQKLYQSIKKKGCQVPPIITADGCRLNGSHRIAILNHLGVKQSHVNVVCYEDHYTQKKSQKIRKQVVQYRKEVYGL